MNDSLLEALQPATYLQRLVIHVHGIWDEHPGTSEEIWAKFTTQHPNCLVRISLIHAYDEVAHLEDHILKENMPLSHLKVLFCENVSIVQFLIVYTLLSLNEKKHSKSIFFP